ncbi:MAG: sigma-70 family RNA polymerase sigma factor [Clostridia bacterium]|nr:sigma-70 family RNA polymerase sigma factor [Clostridia bacterium]
MTFAEINSPEELRLAKEGDRAAFDRIIAANLGLVRSIAARFTGRGTEYEDLVQIGSIGLIKALKNFDLGAGTCFSTYAVPMVTGEIKKHLRDDGAIKVSRNIKRDAANVARKRQDFIKENGREPTVNELASLTGISAENVVAACEASAPMLSFSAPLGDATLENLVGTDNIAETCEKLSLRQAISRLDPEERAIVELRYFLGRSQKETGERLGLTQVTVSRREKHILQKLRESLL